MVIRNDSLLFLVGLLLILELSVVTKAVPEKSLSISRSFSEELTKNGHDIESSNNTWKAWTSEYQENSISLEWIKRHLSTKSPYPHEKMHSKPLNDIPEGYELIQLHLICRHGTRYPSSSNAVAFQKLAERLSQVNIPGFEWLKAWPSEKLYPVSKGNLLSTSGDSDLYRIGRRFATRYGDFLDRYPYSANTYEFQSSFKSRSRQSAYAFSIGLLEGRHSSKYLGETIVPPVQPVDIFALPIGIDKELAVKYACPRWLDYTKYGNNVAKEKLRYQEGFLPDLADRLSAMFSTDNGTGRVNVTSKDVETIYGICGFEVSLYNNDQTWCQLLLSATSDSTSDKLINQRSNFLNMEISNDLGDYYSYGPGIPFNRHLGCNVATSLYTSIERALDSKEDYSSLQNGDNDEEGPLFYRGQFKFGHSESILFLSSFLGLYNQKGIPLTGDMTWEQYSQREFRASKISPFAANIGFEVYRPKSRNSNSKMRIKYGKEQQEPLFEFGSSEGLVRLLINETPTLIPGCNSEYFCQWETFKAILNRLGAGCDFDECCKSRDPEKYSFKRSTYNNTSTVCLSTDPITKT